MVSILGVLASCFGVDAEFTFEVKLNAIDPAAMVQVAVATAVGAGEKEVGALP